jgi:hypothetical protein
MRLGVALETLEKKPRNLDWIIDRVANRQPQRRIGNDLFDVADKKLWIVCTCGKRALANQHSITVDEDKRRSKSFASRIRYEFGYALFVGIGNLGLRHPKVNANGTYFAHDLPPRKINLFAS